MRKAYRSSYIKVLSALFLVLGCASLASAQQVTITSPSSGAVYSPGATIDVTATVTGGHVIGVNVGAKDLGMSAYQFTAPYSFSLSVPRDVVGPRSLFAVGLVASETAIFSPSVTVDIEPSTAPSSINFQQPLVAFLYVGHQERIGVTATFADGSTLDISKSTQLTLTSGNTSFVSVDSTGLMTSLAPGNTTITASFGNATAILQTAGPTGVRADLNGDGQVTVDDLLLLELMVGSTPTGPNDARDLNGDGKIDNLDVLELLTLCGANCPSLNATTTKLVSSISQVQFAQPLTFTTTVSGTGSQAPRGAVSFVVDGQVTDVGLLGATDQASVVSDSLSVGPHTVSALYGGDASNAPSSSQSVLVTIVSVPGDVNGDGAVDCLDLNLVKAAFGKRTGQPGFNAAADLNHDGVINVLDLSMVARLVPVGTTCP
jgi:Dockerin type I domain/Bacterial Ig-like domain (group 3)/Bacterial Ig-like domain (group 2)